MLFGILDTFALVWLWWSLFTNLSCELTYHLLISTANYDSVC